MNRNVSGSLPILMMLLVFSLADNRLAGQPPRSFAQFPGNAMMQDSTGQDSTSGGSVSGTQKKIRDVLQGQQPAPTGDGVLEDVLGVIQRQGSVLDGSVLDVAPLAENAVVENPKLAPSSALSPAARRARVAEQLLRAARMLEQIPVNESSLALVASMRRQAGALLVAGESPDQ